MIYNINTNNDIYIDSFNNNSSDHILDYNSFIYYNNIALVYANILSINTDVIIIDINSDIYNNYFSHLKLDIMTTYTYIIKSPYNSKYIIFVNGPKYIHNFDNFFLLQQTYNNIFKLCYEYNFNYIALSSISTYHNLINNYPINNASHIAILSALNNNKFRIIFCCYNMDEYLIYKKNLLL